MVRFTQHLIQISRPAKWGRQKESIRSSGCHRESKRSLEYIAVCSNEQTLHVQIFQQFIDQQGGPDDGFEEPHYAHPECGGMTNVIDQRAEKPKAIDRRRTTSIDHFLFARLPFRRLCIRGHCILLLFTISNYQYIRHRLEKSCTSFHLLGRNRHALLVDMEAEEKQPGIICAHAAKTKSESFSYPRLAGYADRVARIYWHHRHDPGGYLCFIHPVRGIEE